MRMSEIEKMYENAEIEPIYPYTKCYPEFTAEKQIEIIKTIETKCDFVDCIQIVYRPMEDLWKISIIPVLEMAFEEIHLYFGCDKDFSIALAMAINNLWQDLSEEEKQKVKGILE